MEFEFEFELNKYRERKCADTIGTVLVPWAGNFHLYLEIKYSVAILSNRTRELLWFEITKMLIVV